MVSEAEQYREQDETQKERIGAKNGLEAYIFNMKASLDQEGIKAKLSEAEVGEAKQLLDSALSWLDLNQLGEKEEYEDKQRELEHSLKPLMEKVYGGAAAGQSCGQQARQA